MDFHPLCRLSTGDGRLTPMFEQAYGSVYHHPLVMWAVGAVVLALLLWRQAPRKGFLGVALVVFQLEIMLDAWLTGGLKPIPSEGTIATATAVTFVILGDLRYFVLLGRYGKGGWRVLPAALVVPILSNVARFVWPGNFRALFLTYELMFVCLAVGLRFAVVPRLGVRRDFLRKVTDFEIGQYLLWATADVAILLGADGGYLLRLVPNLMYYAAFVPFVWGVAPEELAP